MKQITLAALGAALVLSGCVAYPVDRDHNGDGRGEYRYGQRYDGGHGDWHRSRDHDQDSERERDHGP